LIFLQLKLYITSYKGCWLYAFRIVYFSLKKKFWLRHCVC
jgi:hypothetical protein